MADKTPEKKPLLRANEALKSERIAEVAKQLLRGYTRSQIMRFGANWGLKPRQMDEYIQWATKEIQEINKNSIEKDRAVILSNLWQLYGDPGDREKGGNRDDNRKILMDIARIQGLDQYSVSHTIKDARELEELPDFELEAVLDEAP